jgi:hypothetical protein
LNPQRYLEDVITRLTAGADFDLDQLLPGNWVPAL